MTQRLKMTFMENIEYKYVYIINYQKTKKGPTEFHRVWFIDILTMDFDKIHLNLNTGLKRIIQIF